MPEAMNLISTHDVDKQNFWGDKKLETNYSQ